jgi:hypothetical protein
LEANAGGGAAGNRSVKNPFRKESWNLTEQMKLQKSDLLSGARDCSGAAGYFRICVCDDNGDDVLPYSNAVHSDGL